MTTTNNKLSDMADRLKPWLDRVPRHHQRQVELELEKLALVVGRVVADVPESPDPTPAA